MEHLFKVLGRHALTLWVLLLLGGGIFWPAPGFARNETQYALELWRKGRIKEAAQSMERVLYTHPNDAEAWNDFGMMNLALGKTSEAEKAFARTLSLKPGHADASLNMGNLLRYKGKPERALEWFNTGLAWHGKDTRLLLGRAQTHVETQNYAKALQDLHAAYTGAPQNTSVLNEYAWFLATCPDDGIRDCNQALKLARRAVEEATGLEAGLYDTLAAALAECGRFDEAVEMQKKALSVAHANGYPKSLLETWRERYGMYKLHIPYRQRVDIAQ